MAAAAPAIRFYFDYISSNAYLAYHDDVYAACVHDPEGHALEAVFAP